MSVVNDLPTAVKRLRELRGDTQPKFAERLGVSVRSVANYEADRIPTIGVLFTLAKLAREANAPELEQVFGTVVQEKLLDGTEPETEWEKDWIAAVLAIVRNKHFVRQWESFGTAFLDALGDIKQAIERGETVHANPDRIFVTLLELRAAIFPTPEDKIAELTMERVLRTDEDPRTAMKNVLRENQPLLLQLAQELNVPLVRSLKGAGNRKESVRAPVQKKGDKKRGKK